MRLLLRLLAPLLGLALAGAGLLLVIEVVGAWVQPAGAGGLLLPWPQWQRSLGTVTWADSPVPEIAIGIAVLGLVLMLIGLLARRSDIALQPPAPEITVTTSPRVLARLVGRRVRTDEDIAAATVTASRRRVAVNARGWAEPDAQRQAAVASRVGELLDELPLRRRPRVAVRLTRQGGPR